MAEVNTISPTEVGGFIREGFLPEKRALVLTSATLYAGEDDPFVLRRLGLMPSPEDRPLKLHRAGTPFDLQKQTLVVLVSDAPDPTSDEFVEWAAARISGLSQFMGGRLLGLFASTRRLEAVAQKVRPALESAGIEVLQQSRGAGRALAARQERDTRSILLGTKSFWQGVDIPGSGVGLVFIDKLPIEPASRPVLAAREERLAEAGLNGFRRYRLPRALIQLRQGVGRLIRSAEDRGVVVIADPGSPGYRGLVLSALQGYRVEVLPWAKARVRIFDSLVEMGLADPAYLARAEAARGAVAQG